MLSISSTAERVQVGTTRPPRQPRLLPRLLIHATTHTLTEPWVSHQEHHAVAGSQIQCHGCLTPHIEGWQLQLTCLRAAVTTS